MKNQTTTTSTPKTNFCAQIDNSLLGKLTALKKKHNLTTNIELLNFLVEMESENELQAKELELQAAQKDTIVGKNMFPCVGGFTSSQNIERYIIDQLKNPTRKINSNQITLYFAELGLSAADKNTVKKIVAYYNQNNEIDNHNKAMDLRD